MRKAVQSSIAMSVDSLHNASKRISAVAIVWETQTSPRLWTGGGSHLGARKRAYAETEVQRTWLACITDLGDIVPVCATQMDTWSRLLFVDPPNTAPKLHRRR